MSSGTPQRQFVELRDLSPSMHDTGYARPAYDDYDRRHSNELAEPIDSDRTYHENDNDNEPGNVDHETSSQSPIIENEKRPKARRRKAWQDNNREERITRAGKIYKQIMNFSFITRWLIFIVPLAILLAVPIIVGAFVTKAEIGEVRIVWLFLWIEVVWLGLWVAKFVARILPYIFRFLISVVSVSTTKYAGIIKALEFPLALIFWSLICLSTFTPIMTRNPTQRARGDTTIKHWESIMAKILTAFFLSSAFFLIEKFLVHLLAISFHKVQFEMRIMENKWAVQMLAKLLACSREMFPRFEGDFMEEDHLLEPAAFTGFKAKSKGSRPGSNGAVTPMQFVNGARRVFQVGAGIVGAVGQEVSGKKKRPESMTEYTIVIEALLHQGRLEALARRIWLSFVQEGNEALLPEDMLDVFGDEDHENAEAAFTYFDEDLNGDISLQEMIMKIQEVAKERKAIAASLKDTDSAIGKLDNALCAIVLIICAFIFIALLDTSFKTLLATSATGLLSLSFIFGTTCQEIMASLIFVFVKHPFDVSDRVVINDKKYVVQEMSLMFTILKRGDGTQVQAPNSLLNTLFIENIRRSAAMTETISIGVDFGTTFEKIEALRQEMQEFVLQESRDFQSNFDITVNNFTNLTTTNIDLTIRHKANWQNEPLRAQRRNKWMCALALAIRKLEIVAGGPGSGDPANPFVIRQIEGISGQKSSSADPFSTPAGTVTRDASNLSAVRSGTATTAPLDFDPTFGVSSRATADDAFDVDLRSEGASQPIDARLPFTIAEETDVLIADERQRQQHTAAAAVNDDETSRTSGSRISRTVSRSLTGRRSTLSRRRVRDDEV